MKKTARVIERVDKGPGKPRLTLLEKGPGSGEPLEILIREKIRKIKKEVRSLEGTEVIDVKTLGKFMDESINGIKGKIRKSKRTTPNKARRPNPCVKGKKVLIMSAVSILLLGGTAF